MRTDDGGPVLLAYFDAHRADMLEFTRWPQTQLERIEALEQLRALAHGVKIKVVEASTPSTGVDTPADLEKVRAKLSALTLQNA